MKLQKIILSYKNKKNLNDEKKEINDNNNNLHFRSILKFKNKKIIDFNNLNDNDKIIEKKYIENNNVDIPNRLVLNLKKYNINETKKNFFNNENFFVNNLNRKYNSIDLNLHNKNYNNKEIEIVNNNIINELNLKLLKLENRTKKIEKRNKFYLKIIKDNNLLNYKKSFSINQNKFSSCELPILNYNKHKSDYFNNSNYNENERNKNSFLSKSKSIEIKNNYKLNKEKENKFFKKTQKNIFNFNNEIKELLNRNLIEKKFEENHINYELNLIKNDIKNILNKLENKNNN